MFILFLQYQYYRRLVTNTPVVVYRQQKLVSVVEEAGSSKIQDGRRGCLAECATRGMGAIKRVRYERYSVEIWDKNDENDIARPNATRRIESLGCKMLYVLYAEFFWSFAFQVNAVYLFSVTKQSVIFIASLSSDLLVAEEYDEFHKLFGITSTPI